MDITLIISGGILLGCIVGLSWFAGSDAPYVPSNMDKIREILKIGGVKKGKKFYELGSGDGRVVIAGAKLGATSFGVEQSLIRVLYSKYKTRSQKLKKVHFYHGNIFSRQYHDADVIYIYLLPKGVNRLEEKLKRELKKGAVVISQTYHFKNWRPFKKIGAGNFWFYKV